VFPDVTWHAQQFASPKRSTEHLARFAARVTGGQPVATAIDVGCGAGANMLHLSQTFPDTRWTGVDLKDEFLDAGRDHLEHDRFELIQGDLYDLRESVGDRRFDASFSIQTLSWLDDYEKPVEEMLAVTDGWVIASSLFSPSAMDAFIRVEGRLAGPHEGTSSHYNVYSLPRFEKFVRDRGATEVVAEPFDIDIDLDPPEDGGMGTYTERTADGRRLQFSGPIAMPWWFVAVRTG
jgi:hypothetical protein